jgi:hypothetical protein
MGLLVLCLVYSGCPKKPSFKERKSITKEHEVDYLATVNNLSEAEKLKPRNIFLKHVSDKLTVAFDEIQKTKNPLHKPYLVNVILNHINYASYTEKRKDDVYCVCIEWFERRFMPHFVQFKNTETSEIWIYNFQCDYANSMNKSKLGIRYLEEYQFGVQEKGGKVVSVEDGMKLIELAKTNKLTAVLVKEDGTPLSNEIIVDFIEIIGHAQSAKIEKP